MPMPLEGLRVIDWTIWQQGPVASAMLGDLGAEVIKLESKDGGDPGRGIVAIAGQGAKRLNFYFEANNRNKQSLALDLKRPEAREIVYRLAACSDRYWIPMRARPDSRHCACYAATRSTRSSRPLRSGSTRIRSRTASRRSANGTASTSTTPTRACASTSRC